jgi:glycerophosphoryl diester phosphodiesterase
MLQRIIFSLLLAFTWASQVSAQTSLLPAREKPKPFAFATAAELRDYLRWTPQAKPLVSAHRGGPAGNLPENTIEAFDYAHSLDPQVIIECDVQLSRDSVLVMTHDDNLSRTAGLNVAVKALMADSLVKIPLLDIFSRPSRYHMPTLDEVLAWSNKRSLLTVDVKRGIPYPKVLAAIQRAKAQNRALLITYNLADAEWCHANDPEIILSVTVRNEKELEALKASKVDLKRMVAFVGVSEPNRKLYEGLHALGIRCILGILGNLEKKAMSKIGNAGVKIVREFVKDGADILATNEVEYVHSALNWRGKL